MAFSIAVTGKGGTGKTSVASLVIRYLRNKSAGPILAIDADANANLGESIGLPVRETVGSIIAAFNTDKINIPPGMTKEAYLQYRLNEIVVESPGLDLVTMGRGEGPDCYCYPNTVLRKFIDGLSGSYAYAVMDNEAGMEHLSRRTTQNVDELLLISDHSVKGVRTVGRLRDLIKELKLRVKRESVIINRVASGLDAGVSAELARLGIDQPVIIPADQQVYGYDLALRPLVELPDNTPAVTAINSLMDKLLKDRGQA